MKYILILLLAASCTKEYTYSPRTTAKITSIVNSGTLYLSAQDSYSASGRPLSTYQWEVGSAKFTGEKAVFMGNAGVYLVKLRVVDDANNQDSVYQSITIK